MAEIKISISIGFATWSSIPASKAACTSSANAFAEDVQAALDAGMDDHVAKPMDMDILISAIEKCVKR